MDDLQQSLAERMEQVVWHNHYFSAICPFPHDGHKESHPSMLVYPDGYKCLGCGKSSHNLRSLLSKVSNTSFLQEDAPAKPNILPKWMRWGYRFGDVPEIAAAAHRFLLNDKGHRSFFKTRKIDQFIEDGYFGYIDGWALFPVKDQDGKIIDIVVRATTGKGNTKYVVRPSKDRLCPNIYVPNWERVLASDTVYVPYGLIDAWALEDIGLPAITGTTGKSLSPVQLKPLGKKLVIIPDRYEEVDAYHLANQLGWKARVQRIKWPSGMKDCDNIRVQLGKDALRQYIGV